MRLMFSGVVSQDDKEAVRFSEANSCFINNLFRNLSVNILDCRAFLVVFENVWSWVKIKRTGGREWLYIGWSWRCRRIWWLASCWWVMFGRASCRNATLRICIDWFCWGHNKQLSPIVFWDDGSSWLWKRDNFQRMLVLWIQLFSYRGRS